MLIRTFSDGEGFRCAGNEYVMLLPRDITECCEVVLERIAPGRKTPPNAHATFAQIYVVIKGEAEIIIGEETRRVAAPAVAFIPLKTNHRVVNTGSGELEYMYITIWPGRIPEQEWEGGWKKACAEMIRDYAKRGYPNAPSVAGAPARKD